MQSASKVRLAQLRQLSVHLDYEEFLIFVRDSRARKAREHTRKLLRARRHGPWGLVLVVLSTFICSLLRTLRKGMMLFNQGAQVTMVLFSEALCKKNKMIVRNNIHL